MKALAEEALDLIKQDAPKLLPFPSFADIDNDGEYQHAGDDHFVPGNTSAVILHSSGIQFFLSHTISSLYKCFSGSTAFPKPILLTHETLIEWSSPIC